MLVRSGLAVLALASLLAAYPPATEEAWRTTVNLARIETPNRAWNQVPALAEAWIDIRFPPEDTDLNGKTAQEITAYLAAFCEPGVTPVVNHADPPHHADRHRPEIRSLQQAVRNQGYRPDFLRKHGAADGRFYYQRGTDAVIFGVGGDAIPPSDEIRRWFEITMGVDGFRGYVARVGGAIAGGGSMRIDGRVAQFSGAGTLPAFRRRGVQTALYRARVADASGRLYNLAPDDPAIADSDVAAFDPLIGDDLTTPHEPTRHPSSALDFL